MDHKTISAIDKVLTERADSGFKPTNAQRALRSQFWLRVAASPMGTLPPEPNHALAAQYVDLGANWSIPGFPQWLWNQNDFNERTDYLAHLCLDMIEKVLTGATSADTAKLAAAKLIFEATKKIGKSDTDTSGDDKISKMTRLELEEFIRNKTPKLVPLDK